MKITIITGPFLPVPPAPCGAVERIWHELAGEFSARGHEVTFLCRDHQDQQLNETIHGIRFIRRTRFKRSRYLWWDLVRDLVYSCRILPLVPPSDIVVTNSFWLPILLPILCRRAGKIVVNVARMPKGQIGWYRGVNRLAAVSNAVRHAIALQCPQMVPLVKVIPNPIDLNVFTPPAVSRPTGGVRTVLYAGRVHPEKGVHMLIDAFRLLEKRVGSIRLQVVGPTEVASGGGGSRYLQQLKALADGLPVEFREPLFDKEALASVYQEATLFCYPSLAEQGESFGLAPLEAMATGLVPVVSDLACFHDFIRPGRTGVIFDHRAANAPARLAGALQHLLSDPVLMREMGEQAAAQALSFGIVRVADEYLKDFEELLAGHAH